MSKDTSPESSPQEESSIGEFLKTEREKKGILKSHLAETIKVRGHVIDALENEEWDRLPARVFIKGFIRSYTISIGIDTQKALRLFDKSVPTRKEDAPVPLTGRKKKNKTMYYAFPVLIILAAAIYVFSVHDRAGNNMESDKAVSEISPLPAEAGPEQSPPEQVKPVETSKPDEVKETIVKESTIQETTPPPEPEKEVTVQEEPLQTSEEKLEEGEKPEEITEETAPVEEIIQDETVMEEEEPEPEAVSTEPPTPQMTLSAMIIERTYVRMIVDDNPPKEYIFQPGKTPQWTAVRGFEATVGNAAGIEFEFNGETFKNLGRAGRVKTFRFPKDFITNWKEEE
ncbi:MAG: DUF4115 domain-containing protein [Desulfobacteraceae bacterium]|jgi:cytoskeleton protein RodZ